MTKNLPIILLGILTFFIFGIMLSHGQELTSTEGTTYTPEGNIILQESSSKPFVLPKEVETVEQKQKEIDRLKLLVSQYAEKYYSCSDKPVLVTVPLSWTRFSRDQ